MQPAGGSEDPPAYYAWKRLDAANGLGVARLWAREEIGVSATEIIVEEEETWSVFFMIRLTTDWVPTRAGASVQTPDAIHFVDLEHDGRGHWTLNGEEAPFLDGATDIDIVSTPLTNTFPIRRLRLEPGASEEIVAAWIDVPSLEVHRMEQRYERLDPANGADRYRYRSLPNGRSYIISVDGEGVAIEYEDFATRVWPSP